MTKAHLMYTKTKDQIKFKIQDIQKRTMLRYLNKMLSKKLRSGMVGNKIIIMTERNMASNAKFIIDHYNKKNPIP